mmetsp:Transcript_81499/g.147183  ORF Transcript_81499/g.147183 Transcript_81499/m.147183 type:complete len:122 (+) Transcript_81499:163-528(+)
MHPRSCLFGGAEVAVRAAVCFAAAVRPEVEVAARPALSLLVMLPRLQTCARYTVTRSLTKQFCGAGRNSTHRPLLIQQVFPVSEINEGVFDLRKGDAIVVRMGCYRYRSHRKHVLTCGTSR